MSTLHQRVQHFYTVDRFRFKPRNYQDMGTRLIALWKELYPDVTPTQVESKEEHGVFSVADYPDSFTTIIDQLIRNCKKEILDAAQQRREKEQSQSTPQKDYSAPPVGRPLRKRIRKPVWRSR